MRKVIPYIASQFRKDKIWLRRTKPSKRQYQIMLAVDDSSSMNDNHSKQVKKGGREGREKNWYGDWRFEKTAASNRRPYDYDCLKVYSFFIHTWYLPSKSAIAYRLTPCDILYRSLLIER